MKMVEWYNPSQLLKTAQEVVVSTIFGRHADYRLLEAIGRDSYKIYDYTKDENGQPRDQIWIDYVADTGDGWDSTYTVAYYAAQLRLAVRAPDGSSHQTERGKILVFGGDEVYPTPSRKEYEQRLVRPYQTALPLTEPPHPHVFAIPGNHDWYDSLVSFTRLFCSKQWFAGWQAPQSLSYFALRLPQGWWLLGTDVQLGSDIDGPQVEYFQKVAEQMNPGDHIILCNAEPHWIYAGIYREYDDSVYNESNLAFLESDKVLGRKVSVFIAGDLHHYRRHEAADQTQKITAGGGGAFLHPTHGPDVSILPGGYTLKKSFPDITASRRLCRRNFLFPFLNPLFGVLTGFFYTLTAWSAMTNVGIFGIREIFPAVSAAINGVLNKPLAVFWGLAIFFGFVLFTDTHSKLYRWIMGPVHGMTHVIATFFIGWGATYLGVTELGLPFGSTRQLLLAGILIFPVGWVVGSFIMGIYLLVSLNIFKRHSNESFSSLRIQDWKHFLRLRIDASGNLTIFPIGIRKVPRVWGARRNGETGSQLIPEDRSATAPELIEKPISIGKETAVSNHASTSLRFTEEMKGFVTFGETDFQRGLEEGKKSNTALMFQLTITMTDVAHFAEDPKHEGTADGYVRCDKLGGERRVEKGMFNLFVDTDGPKRKKMLYRLFFHDGGGQALTFTGFKDVKDDPGVDSIWKDTSTLYTRILRGHVQPEGDANAEIVAAGVIIIHELDFLKQLTTIRVEGPTLAARSEALGQFGKLFLGSLWEVYGPKIPWPH